MEKKSGTMNPQALPISEEETILHDKLFSLVVKDDVDSDYCIVYNDINDTEDGPAVKKATGDNFNGAEGLDSVSFKTVPDGANANKSLLLDPKVGQSNLNPAGNVLNNPNVNLGESSKGEAVEPMHHCSVPVLDFGPIENNAVFDPKNYNYLNFKDDTVELQYEVDLRLATNLEMKHMEADDKSLFRAVASQVYGNSELYNLTRQTCRVFMMGNREHFIRFANGKVHGKLEELRALACAYNCPIYIYYYNTEPVQIVLPPYAGNSTPIRLSYHVGGHYNSLIDLAHPFPIERLPAAKHANFPGSMMMMSSFEVNHYARDKWIHNSPRGSSTADLVDAVSAWEAGAELTLGGSIVFRGIQYNCIELALCLGFEFQKIAAAYSIFRNDGSSLLYYLFESDTYTQ